MTCNTDSTGWNLDLGHSEQRFTVTTDGYGTDPDDGEALLTGFDDEHPEVGATVTQDSHADTISVTFSVQALDSEHAMALAREIWSSGGNASGLPATRVLRIESEVVDPDLAGYEGDQFPQMAA